MLDCYVNALVLSPPVILGRRLLDLSLYHCAILDVLGSPYIHGGMKTIDDLAQGVWVCSRSPSQIRSGLRGSMKRDLFWMGLRNRRADLQREGAAFERYMQEYQRMPEWWSSGGHARRVPWYFGVAWAIMERVGEERAWAMSVSLALSYYAAEADAQGSRSVMTEEELEAERLLAGVSNGGS